MLFLLLSILSNTIVKQNTMLGKRNSGEAPETVIFTQ